MYKYLIKYIEAPWFKTNDPFIEWFNLSSGQKNLNPEPMVFLLTIFSFAHILINRSLLYDIPFIRVLADPSIGRGIYDVAFVLFSLLICFVFMKFLIWLVNKRSSFFNFKLQETISGKTFFFRNIILVIFSIYVLEFFYEAPQEHVEPGHKSVVYWYFLYAIAYLYVTKLQLIFLLKRMNAVFIKNVNTIKWVFYFVLVTEIYFLIEDLSFIEIQQTLIPEETIFIVLLILNLLIFIYLTVKNSPITDYKKHTG